MKKALFNNPLITSLIMLLLHFPNQLHAENTTSATVIKIRGKVEATINGTKKMIKKGDKIPPKTFLESQAKSFAIIVFKDKTKLTLGPKSKIQVVNPSTDKDPGIINLLQGQIRNKIQKPGKMNKYFVNSKAAAIGVRGTEFIAIYNSKTNSLTSGGFSGVVAIGPSIKGDLTVKAANNTIKDGGKGMYFLKAKHFSSVKSTPDGLQISAPRKLSAIQFNQLKNNPEPVFKKQKRLSKTSKKRSTSLPNLPSSVQNVAISQVSTPSSAKGPEASGSKQMPPGSFVDLKTGAIIPPPPGSEFDPNSGTYLIDSSMGSIAEDGSYVPPEGLEINEKGEFAPTEKESIESRSESNQKIAETNKKAKALNNLVAKATNAESVMVNPTSKAVTELNQNLGNMNEKKPDGPSETANVPTKNVADTDLSLENVSSSDEDSETSDSVSMDLSCPGNICDRFDTVAPTSDEASQKTLVQFTIRVNRN